MLQAGPNQPTVFESLRRPRLRARLYLMRVTLIRRVEPSASSLGDFHWLPTFARSIGSLKDMFFAEPIVVVKALMPSESSLPT
jgi:hypothetical protein